MPLYGGSSGSGSGSGFTNRGSWASATAYAANDIAYYGGSTYLALAASTGVVPGTDATKWQIWAQAGAAGANGANGSDGLNGTSTGNALLTGGRSVWTSGYSYTVSAATYQIQGSQYASAQTNITLAAADATNDRIDVIAVDTTGTVVVVQGTAASSPAKPDVNPITQLELTFVYVVAASSAPSVTVTNIYLENTEWTTSKSGSGFNLASTNNPFAGSVDIEATTVTNGNYVQFAAGATVDTTTRNNLVLNIRSKAAWPATLSLVFGWQKGNKRVGNLVTLKDGAYGFNSASTSAYQQIVIPLAAFAIAGLAVDTLVATVTGSGAGIGFYLDNLLLQGGVAQSSSSASMIWRRGWSTGVAYNANDVTHYDGTVWLALAGNTNSVPSPGNTNWEAVAGRLTQGRALSVGNLPVFL